MTVGAYVADPADDERFSYLPVASERRFQADWLPRAKELSLVWLPLFVGGVEIEQQDFNDVVAELSQFCQLTAENAELSPAETAVNERAMALVEYLQTAFRLGAQAVYVG